MRGSSMVKVFAKGIELYGSIYAATVLQRVPATYINGYKTVRYQVPEKNLEGYAREFIGKHYHPEGLMFKVRLDNGAGNLNARPESLTLVDKQNNIKSIW